MWRREAEEAWKVQGVLTLINPAALNQFKWKNVADIKAIMPRKTWKSIQTLVWFFVNTKSTRNKSVCSCKILSKLSWMSSTLAWTMSHYWHLMILWESMCTLPREDCSVVASAERNQNFMIREETVASGVGEPGTGPVINFFVCSDVSCDMPCARCCNLLCSLGTP